MIPSPVQTAIGALVVNIGNAVVAFGVLDNARAATVETAVIGLVTVAYMVLQELRHAHTSGTSGRQPASRGKR